MTGVQTCALPIYKAKQLLEISKLLANHEQYLSHALGLFVFAVEEYGKSMLLEKQRKRGNSLHKIHKSLFGFGGRSHKRKINEGLKNLTHKMIQVETSMNVTHNVTDKAKIVSLHASKIPVSIGPSQTGSFSSKDVIDIREDIRWRCFYVDWDNNDRYWKNEFLPDKGELLTLIADLENCIKNSSHP